MSYVFGDCIVDTQRYEVHRCGKRIPLRPKVFRVLGYLIEQRHRVVSRAELLAQVWPNQCVGDETLTSCVKAARQAVGDSGRAQRVIQTMHGRGLRFVADVVVRDVPFALPTVPLPPSEHALAPSCPLVGRETELATVQQWYAVARQGRRQVGLITGEAGIGKTTLVEMFLSSLATERAVWVGRGQCLNQSGAGEAYLPILEALGRLCRGAEGQHFLALLRQYAPSWLGQLPALLPVDKRDTLPGLVGEASQPRMLRELAEALELLTLERPLVLVLEDLHWSDRATLEWLAYVARRRDPARLLVLATYRAAEVRLATPPVYAVTRELLVQGQSAEIVVGALSAQEITTYVTRRFGSGPLATALASMLYQRSRGNPLFLATIVADLMSRGVLREGMSGWELTTVLDAVTLGVPETLRQFIEQQFEQLAPADQALLEAASVTGGDFSAAAVAAGNAGVIEDIETRCTMLARQGQFIQARGTTTWPDGTVASHYGFCHVLYQEVVYTRMPVGRRTRMQQQLGTRLQAASHPGRDMAS